jgi:hypothetical protein
MKDEKLRQPAEQQQQQPLLFCCYRKLGGIRSQFK